MKTRVATSTSCSRRSSGMRRAIWPSSITDWLGQSIHPWRMTVTGSTETLMDEGQFQLLRGAAFALAILAAVALQRLTPHARLRGSWGVNGGLWLVNGLILGVVCGACAFTVADWAARERLGLFNLLSMPSWAIGLA